MNEIRLINIGFGNIISANRLVAIASPESLPIKRIVQDAKQRSMLVDATFGRKTRAVLVMDSQHVVLSALQTETISNRILKEPSKNVDGDLDLDDI